MVIAAKYNLSSYFHITDVYEAVMETIDEAKRLECVMLDIAPGANLDLLFKHLENSRFSEMTLGLSQLAAAN